MRCAIVRASIPPPAASAIALTSGRPASRRTISASGQYVIPSPYGRQRPATTPGAVADVVEQRADEPRLADARDAGDRHRGGHPVRDDALERGAERPELVAAADELAGRSGRTAVVAVDALQPPRLHGRRLAGEQHRGDGGEPGDPVQQPRRHGPHEDVATGGRLLQAPSHVHRVAPGHRLAVVPRPDHHLAGVDPGVDAQALAPARVDLLVERVERGAHLEAAAGGAHGVVLVEDRDAEQHQHRVADHLVDAPAVQLHDPPHLVEVAAHDLLERLGVVSLGERREAADVREHHGDDLARPDRLRRVVAQERAARRAEARLLPRRRSAPGARWHGASLSGPHEPDLVHFLVPPGLAGAARR